jgi:peptidoglycan hydrolase CwlO-like protein
VGTLENNVSSMGGDIQQIQQDISSLDDRVTALENE